MQKTQPQFRSERHKKRGALLWISLTLLLSLQARAENTVPQSQYIHLPQGKAHYLQAGQGEPILMLHGIPTHAGLWRKIVPELARVGNAIALDFLGYGQSDKPLNINYDFASQYQFLSDFIEAQNYRDMTLVVTDLGSVIGIHYALQHPERVKRLVILEGAYMPSQEWIQSITPFQQMMFQQMENPLMAKLALVGMNPVPLFLAMFTKRTLSPQELALYSAPFAEPAIRQKVLQEGMGPATIGKDIQAQTGIADIFNQNAKGLKESLIPILIIKAEPGFLIQQAQLDYAQTHFKNLTVASVGVGSHYLNEDQPLRISNTIATWVASERVREKFYF
ncbi:MAG: alpha/beta fold hydrolase [Candidatus Sericytochromatia bacterium]